MLKSLLFPLVVAVSTGAAQAERLQVQCEGMSGHSYYAAEGMVPADKAGWGQDQISNGEIVVTVDADSGEVDYRYKDATQKWYSPEAEGGTVHLGSIDEDGSFQIVAIFPTSNTIEVLSIGEFSEGTAKLIYSTSRNSAPFLNAKLMTADCTIH